MERHGLEWHEYEWNFFFSFHFISFSFWVNCSFKGIHHEAIMNDSHCSSAHTAAFTIQMELSQKRNKTQSFILGVWAGQKNRWLQQMLSSQSRCRETKSLAQAQCLKPGFYCSGLSENNLRRGSHLEHCHNPHNIQAQTITKLLLLDASHYSSYSKVPDGILWNIAN